MIPADKSRTISRLSDLERDLFADELSNNALLEFYNTAINNGQVVHAIEVLGRLKEKHQRDTQLAGLYIAACLLVNEDNNAMTAIEQLLTFCEHDTGIIQAGLAVRNRIGPLHIAPQKKETISLCMIVRNEAENIAKCLFAVKPLIDEIIIVDTGSEDSTRDIGRLFGAQVHHYSWDQDFSAARNFCLRKASGQWILILDADEMIAAEDFKVLRRMISSTKSKYQAYAFETRNYSHQTNAVGWQPNVGEYEKYEAGLGWYSSVKVRLFTNQRNIRFHFPVHERVEPSLRAGGMKFAVCPVPIHHYGPLNESKNRQKALAYFQLGYMKLDQLGDDFSAVRELAVQAGQLERWNEAVELWQRLLALDPDYQEGLINMAGALWQMAEYHRALVWAIRAVEANGHLKEAWYNVAICRLFLGQIGDAVSILDRLINATPSYMAAQFMSAIAYGCKGDFNTALNLLTTLNGKLAGLALIWALQDSIKRFDAAGLADCVRNLKSLKSHFSEQTH